MKTKKVALTLLFITMLMLPMAYANGDPPDPQPEDPPDKPDEPLPPYQPPDDDDDKPKNPSKFIYIADHRFYWNGHQWTLEPIVTYYLPMPHPRQLYYVRVTGVREDGSGGIFYQLGTNIRKNTRAVTICYPHEWDEEYEHLIWAVIPASEAP